MKKCIRTGIKVLKIVILSVNRLICDCKFYFAALLRRHYRMKFAVI